MKNKGIWISLAAAIGIASSFAVLAANPPPALREIVVQTADVPAYVPEVTELQAMYKKAGTPIGLRVWRATYAGGDTGTIVVSVEFPSFMALAKANETVQSNSDIMSELKKIGSMRKIVSDSLYEQVTE